MSNTSKEPGQNGRLLIADSEQMSCELLQFKFNDEGFEVDLINDGQKALDLDLTAYSLVLVDLMDCTFTGIDLTRSIKLNPNTYQLPIIIMSKQRSIDDVVDALDNGADDFVAKPFSARELVARVRSVLRRRRINTGRRMSSVLSYRGLKVDIGTGMVTIDDKPVSLTRTEYLILSLFLRNRNEFFDRDKIQQQAWDDDNNVSGRAVDTNISRLRKKLGDYGRNIVNRHGYGYGFVE